MKVSKIIIDFFIKKGIKNFFLYQGGNIMHIINEVGKNKKCKFIVPYHEQALSMQVDTMGRLNRYGVGMVTSGPGATNILTGVCSAYYDSVPCFFITGQVGQIHLKKKKTYRQLGFQETDVVSIFKSVTKYVKQIKKASEILYELEKAYQISKSGRPGPVILDIPFNIQRQDVSFKDLNRTKFKSKLNNNKLKELNKIRQLNNFLKDSKKPLILVGGGIKNPDLSNIFLSKISKYKIPFVTTWTSQDITSFNNKYYLGSIGKSGHRSANLATEEADLIITLGQRFAVRNIIGKFGSKSKIVSIDIDKEEILNSQMKIDLGINISIESFLKNWELKKNSNNYSQWNKQTRDLKKNLFEINVICKKKANRNLVNPFIFFRKISKKLSNTSQIHVDIGSNQTWFFQSFEQKKGQKIISHCGHGAVGSAVCSSIAGYFYNKKIKNIVFIGDGGLMMNIQELSYINLKKLPIKIVVLNNSSLGNTFQPSLLAFNKVYGNDNKTGYMAPNIKELCKGFNFKYFEISNNNQIDKNFLNFYNFKSHSILNVKISKFQRTAELNMIDSFEKNIYL